MFGMDTEGVENRGFKGVCFGWKFRRYYIILIATSTEDCGLAYRDNQWKLSNELFASRDPTFRVSSLDRDKPVALFAIQKYQSPSNSLYGSLEQ